jgi:uncharacterized protein YegP (UPF0339 family)
MFEIFQSSNGYRFRLKALNHQIILVSESYNSKDGCTNGIGSVRLNAPYQENYNRLKSKNEQYYFNLKAGNGQIIGTSETYTTISGMDNGIASVKKNAPVALIEDLT